MNILLRLSQNSYFNLQFYQIYEHSNISEKYYTKYVLGFTSLILQVTNFKTSDCLPKTLVKKLARPVGPFFFANFL